MQGGSARKVLVAAALAVLIGVIVRLLRGGPAPAFTAEATSMAPPDTNRSVPAPDAEAVVNAVLQPVADVGTDEVPAPAPDPVVVASAPPSSPVRTTAAGGTPDPPEVLGDISWIPATNGACPTAFPVKANVRSGIFHVDGGAAYDRTNADRCYATPTAAEADGLRASKR